MTALLVAGGVVVGLLVMGFIMLLLVAAAMGKDVAALVVRVAAVEREQEALRRLLMAQTDAIATATSVATRLGGRLAELDAVLTELKAKTGGDVVVAPTRGRGSPH